MKRNIILGIPLSILGIIIIFIAVIPYQQKNKIIFPLRHSVSPKNTQIDKKYSNIRL
jgi:hypothetical protein